MFTCELANIIMSALIQQSSPENLRAGQTEQIYRSLVRVHMQQHIKMPAMRIVHAKVPLGLICNYE